MKKDILARSPCRTTVAEGEIELVQINLLILIMERCIRPTAERCWQPVKEKYLKRRRTYPTRYALKIRDELRYKVRATIESAVKKTFPDSLVVFEGVESNCGNSIEHPTIKS